MNQNGTVKNIEGKTAIISVRRKSMCGDNCKGCSAICNVPTMDIKADIIPDIAVGDEVEIFSEDVSVLKYSFILYGLPLAIMVAVMFLVNFLSFLKQIIFHFYLPDLSNKLSCCPHLLYNLFSQSL